MTEFEIDNKTIILQEELKGLLKILNCYLKGDNVEDEVSNVLHDISNHDLSNFTMKSTLYKSLYCSSFNNNQTSICENSAETTLNEHVLKVAKFHQITLNHRNHQNYLHRRLLKLCSRLCQIYNSKTIPSTPDKAFMKEERESVKCRSPEFISYMLENPGATPGESRENATHLSYNMNNESFASRDKEKRKSNFSRAISRTNKSHKQKHRSNIEDRLFETNDLESESDSISFKNINKQISIKYSTRLEEKLSKTPLKNSDRTLPISHYDVNTFAATTIIEESSPEKQTHSEYHTPLITPLPLHPIEQAIPTVPSSHPSLHTNKELDSLVLIKTKAKKSKYDHYMSINKKNTKFERDCIIRSYKKKKFYTIKPNKKKSQNKVNMDKNKIKEVASKGKKTTRTKPKKLIKTLYSEIKNIPTDENRDINFNESVTFNTKNNANAIKPKERKRKLLNSSSIHLLEI